MAIPIYQSMPRGAINDFSCLTPSIVFTTTLAAGVEQHFTIPGGNSVGASSTSLSNWVAVFTVQDAKNVFYSINGTAVVPTGSFAETMSEMIRNGMGRHVRQSQVISAITPDTTAYLSISMFSISL